MVVTASRQPGARPETIRTRLARFMPRAGAGAWSVAWSAQTERADELTSEEELNVSEHVGCFGAAVAHALSASDICATRLQVTATATPTASVDGTSQPITVEVRATIAGPTVSSMLFESIIRRAAPTCAVWSAVVKTPGIRVNAVMEDGAAAQTPAKTPQPAVRQVASSGSKLANPPSAPRPRMSMPAIGSFAAPAWLTPKLAIIMSGASIFVVVNVAKVLFS